MNRPIPASLAPLLGASGVVLWLIAGMTFIASLFGSRWGESYPAWVWIGAFVVGLVCHGGAILASVLRWQQRQRVSTSGERQRPRSVPVVALGYVALVLVGIAAWAWSLGGEDRFLADNPDAFLVEEAASGDSVAVRSATGVWAVSLDACPGRGDASVMGLGSAVLGRAADISHGTGPHYMRLHVDEQRIECLPPSPEAFRVYVGSLPEGGVEVELQDSTLVLREVVDRMVGDTLATVVPRDADWLAFRATLDSLDVWQWQTRYENPSSDDSSDWTVDITYSDWFVASGGSTRYPGPDGAPEVERSEAFRALLDAVERLARRRIW